MVGFEKCGWWNGIEQAPVRVIREDVLHNNVRHRMAVDHGGRERAGHMRGHTGRVERVRVALVESFSVTREGEAELVELVM